MESYAEQFVITLPSNSQSGNAPDKFRTQLPTSLHFDDDWEVALYTIVYPRTWQNVPAGNMITVTTTVADSSSKEVRYESIPAAHYDSVEILARTIQQQINRDNNPMLPSLRFHSTERKVYFLIPFGTSLQFDSEISAILGLRDGALVDVTSTGASTAAMATDVTAIYVYSNIVQPQVVGNTYSSLLQIVPVQGQFGDIVQYSPPKLLYVPLRSNTISSIEINLARSSAELISFQTGHVIVQLHFQKRNRF
jgi:hypothetical protein